MKYYIIAGEASGDLHGSNLMKALKQEDEAAEFRVWGGDLMQQAGGQLIKHYRDLAFMGFVEVVMNLRTILTNIRFCKKDIAVYRPDVLVLIDYPGFNLRIAKWAKVHNIKVFYYISPQIWAWRSSRAHKIKRLVDRMFVILPFEKAFYQQYNYKVDFVGHPLLDVVDGYKPIAKVGDTLKVSPTLATPSLENLKKPIIALLPGSRKQEINKMLPEMLQLTQAFPNHYFVIAGAPAQPRSFYEDFRQMAREAFPSQVQLVENRTYDLLHFATAAIVTSGTATLETALFNVPEIVCYKGSLLSYWIAKRLINVKYISLVNLIADKPIVKELIQSEFNAENLKVELEKLFDESHVNTLLEDYKDLRQMLGNVGASRRTAELMVGYLRDAGNI